MTELEGLISFWQSISDQYFYLLEPSTLSHIQSTIKSLKELQKLKAGEK